MEACQMPQCSIIVSGNKGSEFSYFGLIFQLELSRKPGSPIAKLAAVGEDAPRAAKGIGGAFPADIATLTSASPADVHFTLTLKTILRFSAQLKLAILFSGLKYGAIDSPKQMLI